MLATREQNGMEYVTCPHCTRMYDNDKDTIPRNCKRCGCPMDMAKGKEFGEAKDGEEKQHALTIIGDRIRGLVDRVEA